jgi:cell division protein FtsQ
MTSTFGSILNRRAVRLVGGAAFVMGLAVLGLLGWQWRSEASVERVAVTGATQAPPDTIRGLTGVAPGTSMSDVRPALVSDRVVRHPWVRAATVTPHWMSGTLAVSITERTPAALAVDAQGRPAYYLDRAGHAMPPPDSAAFNVPLVHGLPPRAPGGGPDRPAAPAPLRRLLAALADTDARRLVSDIEVAPKNRLRLTTVPLDRYGSVSVRLGRGHMARKLRTLRAFARQILTAPPADSVHVIDLRFDGQVITRPRPLDG